MAEKSIQKFGVIQSLLAYSESFAVVESVLVVWNVFDGFDESRLYCGRYFGGWVVDALVNEGEASFGLGGKGGGLPSC